MADACSIQLNNQFLNRGLMFQCSYIYLITMSNFDFTMSLTGTLSSEKLGVTTTVKEQVDNIEVPLM